MRGKIAKKLRTMASAYCREQGIPLGHGYGKSEQVRNRHGLEVALDSTGNPMRDPDGTNLVRHVYKPGTIYTGWAWKAVYRRLKLYYKTGELVV